MHTKRFIILCLLDFMCLVLGVLYPLVSVHDHNGHDEEAYVNQEYQYHWNNECPDERCCRVQIAAAQEN